MKCSVPSLGLCSPPDRGTGSHGKKSLTRTHDNYSIKWEVAAGLLSLKASHATEQPPEKGITPLLE